MRVRRLCFVLLLVMLGAPAAWAQWSGSVKATGGVGVVTSLRGKIFEEEDNMPRYLYHEMGQTSAQLKYNSAKFQWTSLLEGKVERLTTDNYHFSASVTDENDAANTLDMNAIIRMNDELPIKVQYRTDATWRPAPGQRFSVWANYNFFYSESSNTTYMANWKSQSENLSQEVPYTWNHTVGAGFRSSHEMGSPRRLLTSELTFDMDDKNQQTIWTTLGYQPGATESDDEAWLRCYRLTPHSRISTFSGNVFLGDSLLTGAARLLVKPGLRYTFIHAIHENSGAILDDWDRYADPAAWRDSTGIREWFHFTSLEFRPNMVAEFNWKGLRAVADYSLAFYGRKLTDSTHLQGYHWLRPYLVGNGRIDWRITSKHKLSLSNTLSIRHPSYLQVCWFDRSGGYIEQLYRGSESLSSTRTRQLKPAYEFTYKRFLASSALTFTRKLDEIEQTWFTEEIDNRTYKVFTWLNDIDSYVFGMTHRLGWRGKVLSANLAVDYNYTVREWRNSDKVKESIDWRATADVTAHLKKGWTFSTDVKYQSAVATFFALFKEYCVLNARIQKEFKRFTLSLEGRDLLDMPEEATYMSEDQMEFWVESTLHNRRLILLGFSWKF